MNVTWALAEGDPILPYLWAFLVKIGFTWLKP